MHIGIDARLPSVRLGGVSEYTLNLIQALAGLDSWDDDDRVTIVQARADRVSRIPPGAARFARADADTPCHDPRERLLLGAEIRAHAFDVFHSPDFIPPSSGARRRVITVHDLGFLDHPEHFTPESHRHYAGQFAWALDAADAVATHSEYVRRQLVDRFRVPPGKVSAIHLAPAPRYADPVDAARVAETLQRHGLAAGFVLCVGTVEPRKNLMTLVRAHDALREERLSDVPLVVAGPTGWRCDDVLDAMRARPDSVRYLGAVAARDLPCLYAAAGVLALPSIHEGFGLTAVEAMQCGCPVVASTGGALPEILGDAALLVGPDDPSDWTIALSRVLHDADLRRALTERGLSRATRLSWQHTAQATLDVYRGRGGPAR